MFLLLKKNTNLFHLIENLVVLVNGDRLPPRTVQHDEVVRLQVHLAHLGNVLRSVARKQQERVLHLGYFVQLRKFGF